MKLNKICSEGINKYSPIKMREILCTSLWKIHRPLVESDPDCWNHYLRVWFYDIISEFISPQAVWQCGVIKKTSFYSSSLDLQQFLFYPLAFLCGTEAVSRLYGSVYKHVCERDIYLWACDLPTAQWGFRFGKRERGCFGNG